VELQRSRQTSKGEKRGWLTPKTVRNWREYITGYLMIAPAVILIGLFGIFPVGFALFVSMYKWRLKRGDMIGLTNYTTAVGNLAYLLVFALGIGALVLAFFRFRKAYRELSEKPGHFWLINLPAILIAMTGISFVRWSVVVLPNILDIANAITGVKKTRELFIKLLGEAFNASAVIQARNLMLWLVLASLIAIAVSIYLWRRPENVKNQGILATAWAGVGVGVILLQYTYSQLMIAYNAAVQAGKDPGMIPQLVSISSGVILLFAGWKIWQSAKNQRSTFLFILRLMAATVFIAGGWIMAAELPIAVAAGDPDLWDGLKATFFYSLGTVPFQLAISLFLAILLFQKLKGSQIFRILFFLPYVTPTVASAAVFRQIFSNRLQAPANSILRTMGLNPLQWLWEPKGIFQLLADKIGIQAWPAWANGPSLALTVIMLYSIWMYVGYDIVIYLAGLGSISREMQEAAQIDGAGNWQVFRHITFPLLSPTTYFLTLIAIIGTFKAFNQIWVMRLDAALGTTDTLSVVIFNEFFTKLRYGYASAMALVLFIIILLFTYINNKTQGSKVFYG
jgi:ABC-type sugar transport system permease subunit